MIFSPSVILVVVSIIVRVMGQYADEVDELFDPWKDNCESMNPGNFTNSSVIPREPPMPYRVSLSKTEITNQQGVYVTLAASGKNTFQGFMIHAIDLGTGEATGQFDNHDEDIDVFTCFGHLDSTAMHVNNTDKNSVKLRWVPDNDEVTFVNFYVTVAEIVNPLRNYWMRQKAGSMKIVKTLRSF
ncbi:uncharacterized protein LOC128994955 [Macrosteles quadrilineatus]|uniref:uncharacterized protein LOC128994955 n=1 Tax=Macrosteles quadrilineatus TaxID=74068 RepID=UPI0023E1A25D|nr:uncharacterized protein LOC128994955 [Macrosteles quadrilineatus]XP_054275783.1 uncharacterized protein LOC128994955 [Macrosteles quadrilineatus]